MLRNLEYQNLSASQFLQQLAPKPTNHSYRANVPQSLRDVFNIGFSLNTFTPSGREDSFWHCLLHCLYPAYDEAPWAMKKKLVSKLKEEADYSAMSTYTKSDLVQRNTTLSYENWNKTTDATLYTMSRLLRLHLFVCDKNITTRIKHYYPNPRYDDSDVLPCVCLLNDQGWYSCVIVNEEYVNGVDSMMLHVLRKTMAANGESDCNKVLRSFARERRNRTEADMDFYCALTNTDRMSLEMEKMTDKLSKLKLQDLKEFVEARGISTSQVEGRVTKAKLLKLLE